jgi:hypothetical protein
VSRSEPCRILVAHPFPDVYGADRVVLEVVMALRAAGMSPTVVIPEPGPMTEWLDEHGLPYRCVSTPVIRRALLRPKEILGLIFHARREFSAVARTIAEIDPHLVYANTITLPFWVLGARRARVPTIAHIHESDERLRLAMVRALAAPLLAADRVIAVSDAAKAFLSRGIPRLEERTVVIHNGRSMPSTQVPATADSTMPRLAIIGRLSQNKGQDIAIAAAHALHLRHRDVRLEIAGDTFAGYEGVERDLRASVSAFGLDNQVTFSGFCADVWELLARTDILLAPSRTDSFPLVVIEAMLARKAIVAADVGGMRELIEDGRNGLLVAPEDAQALAAAIERLLDDPESARRLAEQARSDAVERFSVERFSREIVGAVDEVIAFRRERRGRRGADRMS